MGEIIRIDFRKSHDAVRRAMRRHDPKGRLRSIAAARGNKRSRKGVVNTIERSEIDTIAMESTMIRSVSGRHATAEQISTNLHLDLGDVRFALALIEVEALQTIGPMHAILDPSLIHDADPFAD